MWTGAGSAASSASLPDRIVTLPGGNGFVMALALAGSSASAARAISMGRRRCIAPSSHGAPSRSLEQTASCWRQTDASAQPLDDHRLAHPAGDAHRSIAALAHRATAPVERDSGALPTPIHADRALAVSVARTDTALLLSCRRRSEC